MRSTLIPIVRQTQPLMQDQVENRTYAPRAKVVVVVGALSTHRLEAIGCLTSHVKVVGANTHGWVAVA